MSTGKSMRKWLSVLSLVAVAGLQAGQSARADEELETVDIEEIIRAGDVIPEAELEEELAETGDPLLDELLGVDREFSRRITEKELKNHASRRVQIVVHKSMKPLGYQYMSVSVDGVVQHIFPVSTAWERIAKAKTRSYRASTPTGKFVGDGMQTKRFSNTWQVNLYYVIRFNGGIWLHATTPDHYGALGGPESGGCVRLHIADAETLYKLVSSYGLEQTAITVLGAPGESQTPPAQAKLRKVLSAPTQSEPPRGLADPFAALGLNQ